LPRLFMVAIKIVYRFVRGGPFKKFRREPAHARGGNYRAADS